MTDAATPRPSRPPAVRPAPALPAPSARTVRWEIAIVLGLSLGKSAVYAIVQLIDKATQAPLGDQTTVLNPTVDDRWAFDLTYQLLGIGFALVPVALVLHLMHLRGRDPFRVLGLDLRRPGRDVAWGLGLFAAIGLGTLGVYAAGRALGITTAIVGSAAGAKPMNQLWSGPWFSAVPVLPATGRLRVRTVPPVPCSTTGWAGHGPRGAPASCWRCATTTPPPSSSTAHAASTSSRAAPTTTGARLVNLLPTP